MQENLEVSCGMHGRRIYLQKVLEYRLASRRVHVRPCMVKDSVKSEWAVAQA